MTAVISYWAHKKIEDNHLNKRDYYNMADAHGSGPCDSNIMRVQVPFPAVEWKALEC